MKRTLFWLLPLALVLACYAAWFWVARNAGLRAKILRDAGSENEPALESVLFFPSPDVPADIPIDLIPVVRGLELPTEVVFLPGQPDVALVLEQPGRVVIVQLEKGPPRRWFSVHVDDTFYEKGLLGLAFHPRFLENGRMFLNYTVHEAKEDFSLVTEWHASDPKDPLQAPATFVREILRLKQPFPNHDGGCLRFGPDGMLYIGFGDGGSGGDPLNEGQTGTNWLGSMLRIDVDQGSDADAGVGARAYGIPPDNPFLGRSDVLPETFAIGLRNPWRYTFAPNGRLVVADVGQNTWEEIGYALPGDNLGWRIMEGRACFEPKDCDQKGLRLPFHVYGREDGGSITGGELVLAKGPLEGLYVFGDYLSGRLWALELPEELEAQVKPSSLGEWPIHPSTFARDPAGRLYVADHQRGILFRLEPKP